MTIDTIGNDPDLYDEAMCETAKKKRKAAAAESTSPKPKKRKEGADIATTTPSPNKRPRIEYIDTELDMLQQAVGKDLDLMGDDADILLDKLMCQLVAIKQKKETME